MIAIRSLFFLLPMGLVGATPADPGRTFELGVVGPGGKPVPGAVVEFRTDPNPTAEQVHRGNFVRRGPYGTFVAADADGRLAVDLPQSFDNVDMFIEIPGYGPYWAAWSSGSIPDRFTAELEPAWSVGGVVVDADGKPVAGARIRPSIEFRKRPGLNRQLGSGASVKTDASGKWHVDTVPVSMGDVYVEIDHADFRPLRRPLPRVGFGIEAGREPTAKIVLERGFSLTGRVTDESGKPIAGALVKTKFLNDIRQAKTDANGVYRLAGCEPRAARVVASAAGKSTDMKELPIEPGMGPVDFRLKPGGTVRIRVLDADGKPVPKARIFFQRWRGHFQYFEFDHVGQYADEHGVWAWCEAPTDEFRADICPSDDATGMQLLEQPLVARDEEYVFRLPPALVVTGKVVDAETKKPIKEFRVVPGIRSTPTYMNWARGEGFAANDGHYEFRADRGYLAHLLRIEAKGYLPAVSRDIKSDEGKVVIDFELKKGKDVTAKVVTPRNRPAAKARIALGIAGSQIQVRNGDIDDGSTYAARMETDDDGRFRFPAQDTPFHLVIVHPSGFAHIKSPAEWELTRIIHLEPWCRVEGIYRIGKGPAANVPLEIDVNSVRTFGADGPSIFNQHLTTTGPDGRFVFERVIPGEGRISRRLIFMHNEGASEVTSSPSIRADFPAGKTVRIDIGGTGRAVVGRLQAPDGFTGKIRWNFAYLQAAPVGGGDRLSFTVTVDRDGTFRIDDAPAGEYTMNLYFMENGPPGQLQNHRFRVPAPEGDAAASRPVDLGTLKLK